ncbi:MAG: hypothetical protein KAI47_04585 [Deltaproteobacteria bacterium]|nr:hypothetical protein [Deltaproteobacteria bacterium]
MIRIDRNDATAPDALQTNGAQDLARIRELVQRGELLSKSFNKGIYGSDAVKDALWHMQHKKCCYCEHKLEKKWSTVEHFRPKTTADRGNGTVDTGYWWLAYDFSNLYFACQNCNNPKSARFPLVSGTLGLQPEQDPSTHPESPLIVDPGAEQPERHLTFEWISGRGFQIAPLNGSERGRATIDAAALDRDELMEMRRDHYKDNILPVIKRYRKAVQDGDQERQGEALADARRMTQPEHEYALLAKVAFKRWRLL